MVACVFSPPREFVQGAHNYIIEVLSYFCTVNLQLFLIALVCKTGLFAFKLPLKVNWLNSLSI